MASRTQVALATTLLLGCEGVFGPANHELSECWPGCADASVDPKDAEPSAPDAGDGGAHADAAELALEPLEAAAITPHSITWRWDPGAFSGLRVEGYRVRYGALDEVQRGGGISWTSEDDPNLGYGTSPFGPGVVDRTTVTGLLPGHAYVARLDGLASGRDPVAVAEGDGETIPVGLDELVIFREELPAGAALDVFHSPELSDRAHTGVRSLWLEGHGESAPRVFELELPIREIPEARWARAYLELAIGAQVEARPVALPFVHLMLEGHLGRWSHRYVVAPAVEWQLVEVPLVAFARDGDLVALSPASFGEVLRGFGLAANWPVGARVYVDDVVLRF
ncbi:MAG: fibronectin type III domain-containing protein [Deltaproteobacteria bacterium]|nr:fibronectin type III domain-containing protein [Deltaproteobacteria bacterium]